MPSNAKKTISTVIPAMRYRDANAAIEWLCKAFGFEKHLVVPGENGTNRACATYVREWHDHARFGA
jgi:uncharacterized glyoxalase superfamily protein PhnB